MRLFLKKETIINFWLQILVIVGFNLAYYYVIAREYSYMGFSAEFQQSRFALVTLLSLLLLILGSSIKDSFFKLLWTIFFNIFFVGESIHYQYSLIGKPQIMYSITFFLILLWLVSKLRFSDAKPVLKKDYFILLTVLAVIMFIPIAIKYYGNLNLKNLLLQDVYDTRTNYKANSSGVIGYISEPLVRVLLPYLVVVSIQKKKKLFILLFSFMIIFVYLIGALKSILFGLIVLFFFYFGSYVVKETRLLAVLSGLSWIGLVVYKLFRTPVILNLLVRRVFFLPAYINQVSVAYFSVHPTHLSQSPFGLGIVPYTYQEPLSNWIGDYLLGRTGMNANTGVFNEGYISFGMIGALVAAIIVIIIIIYFKMISFNPLFLGMLFTYIYYINTSFLSTLLLTHGLLFFMIFSFFFLRGRQAKDGS